MLGRLFPRQIDNDYRGHVLAIWILVPLALLKLFQGAGVAGFNPIASSRDILQTADGVPIDTYAADAATHLVFMFASWGLGVFLLGFLALVALIRYRAMIPLVYFLLLIEQIGRKWLSMEHLGRSLMSFALSAGNIVNTSFLAALIIGFALSLSPSRSRT